MLFNCSCFSGANLTLRLIIEETAAKENIYLLFQCIFIVQENHTQDVTAALRSQRYVVKA